MEEAKVVELISSILLRPFFQLRLFLSLVIFAQPFLRFLLFLRDEATPRSQDLCYLCYLCDLLQYCDFRQRHSVLIALLSLLVSPRAGIRL